MGGARGQIFSESIPTLAGGPHCSLLRTVDIWRRRSLIGRASRRIFQFSVLVIDPSLDSGASTLYGVTRTARWYKEAPHMAPLSLVPFLFPAAVATLTSIGVTGPSRDTVDNAGVRNLV